MAVGRGGVGEPAQVIGVQRLLIVPVRFPDVHPGKSLRIVTKKVQRVAKWVERASYAKARLDFHVLDWQLLPAPLEQYRVSAYNFQVDRTRVRRLVEEALSLAARKVRLDDFAYVYILVGAHTTPGTGYGMIAYAANPGMLSGVRHYARLEPLRLADGREVVLPVMVSAENAHPGHVAHDLLHALGGARDGRRAVPDLYDFEIQSNPPSGQRLHPALFGIYTGPWDIMSQHFIELSSPPPPPSSFTRLQLGWIDASQVVTVHPGERREVVLEPLESGRAPLVIRVPRGPGRYLLLENRRQTGLGAVLPASGLLVLEVDEGRQEGSDIVRVADANPSVPGLRRAPYMPNEGERRAYVDALSGVAAMPLGLEPGGRLRVLITTPDEARRTSERR
jgi:M6 family metalloprotease-like protein